MRKVEIVLVLFILGVMGAILIPEMVRRRHINAELRTKYPPSEGTNDTRVVPFEDTLLGQMIAARKADTNWATADVHAFDFEGHRYLRNGDSGLIHAESCQCKSLTSLTFKPF